jgi:hypothetical protein
LLIEQSLSPGCIRQILLEVFLCSFVASFHLFTQVFFDIFASLFVLLFLDVLSNLQLIAAHLPVLTELSLFSLLSVSLIPLLLNL